MQKIFRCTLFIGALLMIPAVLVYVMDINGYSWLTPNNIASITPNATLHKSNLQSDVKSNNSQLERNQKELDIIEAVLRMPSTKGHVNRLFCDFLRTASLFWDASYGPIVLILDEESRRDYFPGNLLGLQLPFQFRLEYEQYPDSPRFVRLARRTRSFGYLRQLYSSFLMDNFTNAEIISWFDTDVYLTSTITRDSIIRNGKLVVKALNTKYPNTVQWSKFTEAFLGVPSSADFMSLFPVNLYASTIKNCREFIMKRFKRDKWIEAFLDALEKGIRMVGGNNPSPVCVLVTYAYFFEHDKYEWHIDLNGDTLADYNKRFAPFNLSISENDLSPELYFTLHISYYGNHIEALRKTVCHTHIAKNNGTVPSHCKDISGPNMILYEFESAKTHHNGWCKGIKGRKRCSEVLKKHYVDVQKKLQSNTKLFNTSNIRLIEDTAFHYFQTQCTPFKY